MLKSFVLFFLLIYLKKKKFSAKKEKFEKTQRLSKNCLLFNRIPVLLVEDSDGLNDLMKVIKQQTFIGIDAEWKSTSTKIRLDF